MLPRNLTPHRMRRTRPAHIVRQLGFPPDAARTANKLGVTAGPPVLIPTALDTLT
ncbi:hypothetical protein P280DRAFT_149969 [Massarina eburnea CBS 473.64]|uniref:Uncharacterized protein n=1 Tax=Massarina eburnea CBS 473.64 TaxID=1395130 RepID=A0A6A6RP78_9PLEO|nr:hypothetical protein P280DRAFT_149969 [Massarina eburnea CBS 473.64]